MKIIDKLRRRNGAPATPLRTRDGEGAATRFGDEIERDIEQLWRAFEVGPLAALSAKLSLLWPAVDEAEDQQGITLRVDVPGLEPKDVDVEVAGNLLTVRGAREETSEHEKTGFRRHERRVGSFCRTITLPPYVDLAKVEASYDKGILTVKVPRIPGEGPRRVTVKSN